MKIETIKLNGKEYELFEAEFYDYVRLERSLHTNMMTILNNISKLDYWSTLLYLLINNKYPDEFASHQDLVNSLPRDSKQFANIMTKVINLAIVLQDSSKKPELETESGEPGKSKNARPKHGTGQTRNA